MSTAYFGTWIAWITWDQFGIADSGAKHAATQGERYRFKGNITDWFAFPHPPVLLRESVDGIVTGYSNVARVVAACCTYLVGVVYAFGCRRLRRVRWGLAALGCLCPGARMSLDLAIFIVNFCAYISLLGGLRGSLLARL